jgi:hypothetical protein
VQVVRFVRARWALLVLLALFGCGTVSVDIQTDVRGEDEVVMAFTIEATGQLAQMLDPENLKRGPGRPGGLGGNAGQDRPDADIERDPHLHQG